MTQHGGYVVYQVMWTQMQARKAQVQQQAPPQQQMPWSVCK
jgi:hypothetical protein